MKRLVLDASVYAPLIAVYGRQLVDSFARAKPIITPLALLETCNAYWKEAVKLRLIDPELAVKCCRVAFRLSRIAVLYELTVEVVVKAMEIAVHNSITFYDASYIAVALRENALLASEDKDIKRVAPAYNVDVIGFEDTARLLGLKA